ncbi:hypothetical protein DFJ58DRAFT_816269 [Suillus subalutaceus]|uniref:uncharacterized protein n=1 Tax=Suillus subalutaceus TaxID=48586 RepID=UPI001B8601C8|nr:uncharacterized protein DFJ58DRAFT_816269 [Suillus subalutaceus]KAG1837279.1 hypothetical protein DFJ58DRAFT_816269 [Suillus subalutaceus]
MDSDYIHFARMPSASGFVDLYSWTHPVGDGVLGDFTFCPARFPLAIVTAHSDIDSHAYDIHMK